MNGFRYILEKGSRKFTCPNCGKKSFVLYIDTETGDYLPNQYGRCDRESKCSYHLNPYNDGYGNQNTKEPAPQNKQYIPPKPVYFDFETFKQTLKHYESNIFIQNLLQNVSFPFEPKDIEDVISLYFLGTVANGYRAGAITFPYIDENNNIRAIQVKEFDNTNHTTGTDFLHSIIEKHHTRNNKPLPEWLKAYKKNETKVSCLFGAHLLNKYPQNPVALVEAPKTAIYGTLYFGFPKQFTDFIWLAVYNKSSFSFDKLKALQGRSVSVFPDLSKDGNTFEEWEAKAKDYEKQLPGTQFIFSDLLEKYATHEQREKGADIADILIKQDWRKFRKQNIPPKVTKVTPQQNNFFSHVVQLPKVEVLTTGQIEHPKKEQTENWDKDISELETYFANITLPTAPIRLNAWTTITDARLFVESNLSFVKANNGNKTFLPYLNQLKIFFDNNKNLQKWD